MTRSASRSTRSGPAGCGTASRCCTRPTRPGTSPTSRSVRRSRAQLDGVRLVWTLVAFSLAVGIARALPRRAARPAARHAPPAPRAASRRGRLARGCGGDRPLGHALDRRLPVAVRASSASCSCSATTSSCSAARCTPTTSSRSAGARSRCSWAASRRRDRSSCRSCSAPRSQRRRASPSATSRTGRGGCAAAGCASRGSIERPGEERELLDIAALTTPAERRCARSRPRTSCSPWRSSRCD